MLSTSRPSDTVIATIIIWSERRTIPFTCYGFKRTSENHNPPPRIPYSTCTTCHHDASRPQLIPQPVTSLPRRSHSHAWFHTGKALPANLLVTVHWPLDTSSIYQLYYTLPIIMIYILPIIIIESAKLIGILVQVAVWSCWCVEVSCSILVDGVFLIFPLVAYQHFALMFVSNLSSDLRAWQKRYNLYY